MGTKLKTHSGASKRFKRTANGFKHRRAFRSHLMTGMPTSAKRRLRSNVNVHSVDAPRVARMLQQR